MAALIEIFPAPAVARFKPVPVIVVPPTVSALPLFVHVWLAPSTMFVLMDCAPAPATLLMPPVPMVSVFAPPIVPLPLDAVKLRLFTEKFAPSVFTRFVAPLVTVKNTSVVAPGTWLVFAVAAAVVYQFAVLAPAANEFHCAP